ncbi:PIN domain-containing protein [Bosea caraganae]|uniref:PIN domain-containing protein n=1 Tax=Bosea caraganae TaxID=2763117 RepID=A0A370L3P1_9HYPH|nr:type II toxin-antitoxin system VapC family toxin [Bosea caraganae]RDJ22960.1 PIN domain-containing protein [Bosea caraganae]RDJ28740.1 PIN domain-containing protein [Bosea caraganae]
MRGIDTNILLRTVDLSDAGQTAVVERLLDEAVGEPLFVNHIVLSEFAWTLARRYRLKRDEIAMRLRHVIEAPDFVVERADLVERALDFFENGKAQFPDCLIGATNLASGCSTTLTFDGDAVGMTDLFSPLRP